MNQGIFDKQMKPSGQPTTVTNIPKKEDFKLPAQAAAENMAKSMAHAKASVRSKELIGEAEQQKAIDNINNAVGTASDKENEETLEQLNKIDPEDLKQAEAMIFNGYAEKTIAIPNFGSHNITVCTNSPEDLDIIEEMIFDLLKLHEDEKTGAINLASEVVKTTRNMLNLAIGYKGMDGKDLHPDKICQMTIIKKAIESLSKFEIEGDIDGLKKMKDSIKKSIQQRAAVIKKLPTPVIDFISQAKFDFDKKMFDIMSLKSIINLS